MAEAKVSDFGNGSYAWVQPTGGWGYANAGLVTSDGEALLVDTLFDAPFTRAMLDGFARVSDAKIKTVFNTHQNGDHWFGNALVPDAEIVATEKAAEAMQHELPSRLAALIKAAPGLGVMGEFLVHCFGQYDFAGAVPKLPDLTFNGHFAKQVGSKRVEMIEVGPAHTGGDAIAHVPLDRTVFTGDILFIDGHPVVWAGPVGNWIAACEQIAAMEVDIIVPGHGPITDKAGVARVAQYLNYIHAEAKKRHHAGLGALEAARSIALDDYANWGDPERIAVNVATLYREFGDESVPTDAAVLFGWMAQLWKDRR